MLKRVTMPPNKSTPAAMNNCKTLEINHDQKPLAPLETNTTKTQETEKYTLRLTMK